MDNERANLGRRDFFKLTGSAVGLAALSYYLGLRDRPHAVPAAADLPEYSDLDLAFPVFRPPFFQRDAKLAAFMFAADANKLTSICERTLNSVPSSVYRYIPLTSSVIVLYADMQVCSLDERDSQAGFIPETEVGFWVLTVAMKKTSRGQVPHHLAWFLPYLLVDEGNSIATGREVYGFNKQAAEFRKPAEITSPEFSADVLGVVKFDTSAIANKERLIELTSTSAESTKSPWQDWTSAQREFMGSVARSIRPDLAAGILEFATRAITDNIPLVFLKQFRDSASGSKACYKAIIEAPLTVKAFSEGGLFSHPHKLILNHLDSHPLARNLGLEDDQISSLSAWMRVDFILHPGVEV